MKSKVKLQKEQDEDMAVEYLSDILVDSFLKKKAKENSKFIYPKIIDPIKELVKKSKERNKLFKNKLNGKTS
jgi:CHAT domain-containing protein